ncbi:hypothetical protein EON67_00880 [archaeon]|nr:MAG: hypothetical protein EON67_00880 [archaeon]
MHVWRHTHPPHAAHTRARGMWYRSLHCTPAATRRLGCPMGMQNIMTYNGAAIIAMTGKNCVAIARYAPACARVCACAQWWLWPCRRAPSVTTLRSAPRAPFRDVQRHALGRAWHDGVL